MGISAQGTQTHLAALTQLVVHAGVDIVVFMLGANEIYRSGDSYQRLLDANSYRYLSMRESGRHWLTRAQIGRRVHQGYRSVLGMLGFPGGWGVREKLPYFAPTRSATALLPKFAGEVEIPQRALDEYERDVISLSGVAKAHGIQVLFIDQPSLWRADLSDEERAVCWLLRYEHGGTYLQITPGDMARVLAAYNERLRDICRRHDLPFLDLASQVPRTLESFYDDVHFNEAGADQAAADVASVILASQQLSGMN
jgi:lysophospholipase L1-like esterase